MLERLYQPDFACIFGKNYANAFLYGQVDSLVWPIFSDVEMSDLLKNLLKQKDVNDKECFYRRKISLDDEKVELKCSNIDLALVQAMDLGRKYGIANSDVITVVKKEPALFKGIVSFNPTKDSKIDVVSELKKIEKDIDIVGIALYPSFSKLDLTDETNSALKELLKYCKNKNYFIKIDIGNSFLPDNHPEYVSYHKIKSFLSKNPKNVIILSGLDILRELKPFIVEKEGAIENILYYQLLKYYPNLWIEIEPRSFGGMTPKDCFKQLFSIKGFIQNCWQRLLIGSATPTLEMAQVARGFLEATEELPFAQKCILRTWAFRNINRINPESITLVEDTYLKLFDTVLNIEQNQVIENDNEVNAVYKVNLRSYSVTQLLYLTELLKKLFNETMKKYPTLSNGELFVRSYHTTTSLVVNEHEQGNYLDLHYKFAEISKKDSSKFMHTVMAEENRADFNHFDHELASTYGSRQLTIPVLNKKLEIGGRENFYILVTFGPRTVQLLVKIKLLKEK
jgi:thiamine phosphate synthase YjbQ (UPF0047 family)